MNMLTAGSIKTLMDAGIDVTNIDKSLIVNAEEVWRQARIGKVTGSRVHDIVKPGKAKGGLSEDRAKYFRQVIVQRLNGKSYDEYNWMTADMKNGIEREPEAQDDYLLNIADGDFIPMGKVFVPHPTIEMAGCSPDAYAGDKGLVEFKCPRATTHYQTLRHQKIDAEYMTQMQWALACHPDREWCDFVSYNPDFDPKWRRCIIRVKPDRARIAELETEVRKFLDEVERELAIFR